MPEAHVVAGAPVRRDLLIAAGYVNVNVAEERGKGWLCAVGTRAS